MWAQILKIFIGILLGAFSGWIVVPRAVRTLIDVKNKKRGREPMRDVMTAKKQIYISAAADACLSAALCILFCPAEAIPAFCMIQIALICVWVDQFIRLIANEAIVLLLALGIVYRIVADGVGSLSGSFGAMLAVAVLFGGCAVFMKLRNGNAGVGAGDLKYAMTLAIAIGWPDLFYFFIGLAAALLFSCLIGIKSGWMRMNSYFPMCLQLTLGFLCALLVPKIHGLF